MWANMEDLLEMLLGIIPSVQTPNGDEMTTFAISLASKTKAMKMI
jgi:hypothetical protein